MNAFTHYDFLILDFVHLNMQSSIGDFFMPLITMLGNGGAIWIILSIILILIKNNRFAGITMLLALILGFLLGNMFLKPLIARIRPCDINSSISLLIPRPSEFSFPSGHTLSSFSAATVLFLIRKKWGIPALILASLISFSRLYLYVHFPSDVLVGAILGITIGYFSVKISTRLSLFKVQQI